MNRKPGENEFRCYQCRKIYDTLDCSEDWNICIFCQQKTFLPGAALRGDKKISKEKSIIRQKVNILKEAIKIAEKNGFKTGNWENNFNLELLTGDENYYKALISTNFYKLLLTDHEFAKALWGDKRIKNAMLDIDYITFECQLQKMVIQYDWLTWMKYELAGDKT